MKRGELLDYWSQRNLSGNTLRQEKKQVPVPHLRQGSLPLLYLKRQVLKLNRVKYLYHSPFMESSEPGL